MLLRCSGPSSNSSAKQLYSSDHAPLLCSNAVRHRQLPPRLTVKRYCGSDIQDHSLLHQLRAAGTPPSATLEGGSNSSSSSSTSQTDAAAAAGTTSRALQQQLSELALSSAGPSSRDAATTASDPLHQQQQHLPPHQQPHQQQHRPERLPRCSTVSLQTELATPSLVVFSGGTAFNSVAGHLRRLTTQVSHVLPVSDDGGSTAEIVRVIGGPAVGDIRSRCLRLADDRDEEARAVRRLLAHRLPGSSSQEAKMEWYSIVEGSHALWGGVSEPYKHMIRAFLVHFQLQILSQVSMAFDFRNGSIGNFFFAGARTFFGSLESAVFLFSRVSRIPQGSTVLPAICTEEVITLGAELEDGTVLRGQNNISHPPEPAADTGSEEAAGPSTVDKSCCAPLPSPVRRVFYLSREGTGQEHEVSPPPNPRVLTSIQGCDAVVYGMGSLYTSICPALILEGVGEAIAARQDVPKLLLLNGSHDRETSSCGAHTGAMRASDVVVAITDALNRRRSRPLDNLQRAAPLRHPHSAYITTLITPKGGDIEVDRDALHFLGITQVIEVASRVDGEGRVVYDPEELVLAVGQLLLGQPSTPAAATGMLGGL